MEPLPADELEPLTLDYLNDLTAITLDTDKRQTSKGKKGSLASRFVPA